MPQQDTALTFDVAILSWRHQSWLGLTHAGVALIHDGPQAPAAHNKKVGHIWVRLIILLKLEYVDTVQACLQHFIFPVNWSLGGRKPYT